MSKSWIKTINYLFGRCRLKDGLKIIHLVSQNHFKNVFVECIPLFFDVLKIRNHFSQKVRGDLSGRCLPPFFNGSLYELRQMPSLLAYYPKERFKTKRDLFWQMTPVKTYIQLVISYQRTVQDPLNQYILSFPMCSKWLPSMCSKWEITFTKGFWKTFLADAYHPFFLNGSVCELWRMPAFIVERTKERFKTKITF